MPLPPGPLLTAEHYAAALECIGEVHDALTLDELRHAVLPALQRLVPSQWASYNEVPVDGSAPVAIMTHEQPPEVVAAAWEAWQRLAPSNPLLQRHLRTRDGRAYRFSDVLTREAYHAMPLYQEVYSVLGVEHQIAFTLPAESGEVIGIALSRDAAHGDFSDAERDLLNLLRPHVLQAYRNCRQGDARAAGRLDPVQLAAALGLTAREGEVLAMLAGGASTEQAAGQLGVSPRTVLKHGERIHRKLGVTGRAQAVALAWGAKTSEREMAGERLGS